MLYDGQCGFCGDAVARWRRATGDAVEFLPHQDRGERFPEVSEADATEAVQWLAEGDRRTGAAAVFAVLAAGGRPRWAAFYDQSAWFARLCEVGYRVVADRRTLTSQLARRVWGTEGEPAAHALTSWLFLRLLGLVFLIAFVSMWVQAAGLIGSDGLAPVQHTLEQASDQYGATAVFRVPTLLWLSASDRALGGLCAAGVFAGLLLMQGIAPRAMLIALWVCYLSLVSVGGPFTAFQSDGLLLEAGLLAILLAPRGVWPRHTETERPSPVAVFLLRFLLFKLMFLSGAVKLISQDDAWRTLHALDDHFWTQPLPTPIGWYASQLPAGVLRVAAAVTLLIEVVVPFLMFFLREAWARRTVFFAFASLQVAIALTGNYGFLNLLTLTLCVLVLQDDDLRRFVPRPLASIFRARPRAATSFWGGLAVLVLAAPVVAISLLAGAQSTRGRHELSAPARAALDAVKPLRSLNGYGMFARMTNGRTELRVEGTRDGAEWRTYHFRYGMEAPGFAPPGHHPRLDWSAWFAGEHLLAVWLDPLGQGLVRGSPAIGGLFANDPFPEGPPRDVRIRYRAVAPSGKTHGWEGTTRWYPLGAWSRRR